MDFVLCEEEINALEHYNVEEILTKKGYNLDQIQFTTKAQQTNFLRKVTEYVDSLLKSHHRFSQPRSKLANIGN